MDFIRDDDYMQARISDMTACLNKEFICKYVTARAENSKISMEADNIFFDGFNDIYDEMFESSATYADTPKGITE